MLKYKIPNVKKIILIASGKGGVGKSTLTVNLSILASINNLKVGIIDADINGPSIAHIMNTHTKPEIKGNMIYPLEKFNIKFLSMGNLIDQNSATIWRSAMYSKMLNQIIVKTNWQELDIVFIDVPPGTGDIHLNLAEKYHIDGVLMISLPQKISLIDARKAVNMYQVLKIPLLGIVANNLFEVNRFDLDRIKEFAKKYNIDFCGNIPFDAKILEIGNEGISIEYFEIIENRYKDLYNKLLYKLELK